MTGRAAVIGSSCSASASAAAPASPMRLEQEVDALVALGVAVGHPDVGHDRRVLRVAAQLALAEDPRRQLLELEPHAPTPTAG